MKLYRYRLVKFNNGNKNIFENSDYSCTFEYDNWMNEYIFKYNQSIENLKIPIRFINKIIVLGYSGCGVICLLHSLYKLDEKMLDNYLDNYDFKG